jgi:hypothetical protein
VVQNSPTGVSESFEIIWLLAEGNEAVTNCNALKMLAADDKMRRTEPINNATNLYRYL